MDTLSDLLEQGYGLGRNPAYEYSRCRWSGTGGTECHACVQACPEGVFPDVKAKKPDYDKCSKCGLCAAACPTRAIAAPQIRVRQFLRALASDEAMSVGCLHDESHFTLRLDCLAALSWEEIACAALKNGVVLSLRACPTCPKRDHYARLMDSLEQVRRFLGDDFFFDRVQLLEEGDEYTGSEAQVSRREFFSLYKKLDPERINRLLPPWEQREKIPALFYRALLKQLVQARRDAADGEKPCYTVTLPQVNANCYNCGVCVRACASRALSFRQSEDGGGFLAVVESWKCIACGRCEQSCREKAIAGERTVRVTQLGKAVVGRCSVVLCSVCGKPRKPSDEDGLCSSCRMKKKVADRALAAKKSEERV